MYHANASVRFIRIDHFALIDRLAWQPKKNQKSKSRSFNAKHKSYIIILYYIILNT